MNTPRPLSRRAALFLSASATFLSVLSTNVVNVALPSIMGAFGADVGSIEWVVTAYMLTFSLLLPVSGWLSDRFGRAPVFVVALAVFVGGALLASLAPSLPFLVAARVVQASGASALGPTAMALLHGAFPPQERGKALGMWAFGATLAPALGPTLGGFLMDHAGWRWIFAIYVPTGLFVLVLALRLLRLRIEPRRRERFDWRGLVGLVLLFVGIHLTIQRLSHGAAVEGALLGVALAASGATVIFLGPAPGAQALIDLGLLRRRNYALAIVLGVVRSFSLFGSVFLLPIYLQKVAGLDATTCALLLLPAPLGLAFGSPLSGSLSARLDTRLLAATGVLLVAGSMLGLHGLGTEAPLPLVVGSQLARGLGLSLLVAPVMAVALNDMPSDRVGSASGLIAVTMQVGGALGIAVLNGALVHRAAALGSAAGELARGSAAAAQAFGDTFVAAGAFALCGLVPALSLLPQRAEPAAATVETEQAG